MQGNVPVCSLDSGQLSSDTWAFRKVLIRLLQRHFSVIDGHKHQRDLFWGLEHSVVRH